MQQPLPPCLIQQPGSDLENQRRFSATGMKRNVLGEQGCANKCEESIGCIRSSRRPSERRGTAGMLPAGSPPSRPRELLLECLNSQRGTVTFLGATACPFPPPPTGKPFAFSPFHSMCDVSVPTRLATAATPQPDQGSRTPRQPHAERGSTPVVPTAHGCCMDTA